MGNSHMKAITPQRLSPKFVTTSIPAFTIEQAHQALSQISSPQQVKAIILHLITNDVVKDDAIVTATKMMDLSIKCANYLPHSQIFISLGIARSDNHHFNTRVQAVNAILQHRFSNDRRIKLIDNSSLAVNGCPCPQFITQDGYHLSQSGTAVLASHFRAALEDKAPGYSFRRNK